MGIQDSGARAALLGTQPKPSFPVSKLLVEYEALTKEETTNFSPNQLRVWRGSCQRVVNELIAITGDKPVTELTREDGLDYRSGTTAASCACDTDPPRSRS